MRFHYKNGDLWNDLTFKIKRVFHVSDLRNFLVVQQGYVVGFKSYELKKKQKKITKEGELHLKYFKVLGCLAMVNIFVNKKKKNLDYIF